ncbi:MAG: hypothetical protein JST16_04870 [Bdellovibrionales bacterium]|nr:hypothetical protein [Bdellovibrionales bacterium]
MDIQTIELPVKALEGYESPSVTTLHVQNDGTVLCGLAFAEPALFRLEFRGAALHATDMGLEKELGKGVLGVVNGLRSTTSGDTAFAVLHEGFAPGFLRKMAGGELLGLSGQALRHNLESQDGGMGLSARHSVVQITEGKLSVRRYREPGALLDAAHIGDFIFGLQGTSIWREPYLNTEKRETLRKDLGGNAALHRDSVGNIWMLGQNGRLLRMAQTDLKAKPTPLKLPEWKEGALFELSAASPIDEWLYGTCADSRTLFRVRVNPISGEDEMQALKGFPSRITGMAFRMPTPATAPVVHKEPTFEGPAPLAKATLYLALEGAEGAELLQGEVEAAEDPELMSELPQFISYGRVPGVQDLSNLNWVGDTLWAGEGHLGCGTLTPRKPRVFRIHV